MTIESAITAGLQAVATGMRSVRSLVTGSPTGTLSGLTTTTKTSVVAAINELKGIGDIGYRYTFSLTAQPKVTWIQPTVLTQVFNTAATQVSLASGSFTFAASTVANVAGWWLFDVQAEPNGSAGFPVAVEVRVGGVSIGRHACGGVSTTLGVNTRAFISQPYRLAGGEVITYHFIFDIPSLLGIGATTSNVVGSVGGVRV